LNAAANFEVVIQGPTSMRLSEDKIKEALLQPDLDVRDTAIRYFSHSTDLDSTVMSLAIQAIEKYGRTTAFSFTHHLNFLPQTEQTISWVVSELQRDLDAPPEEKYFYYMNLSRLLWQTDIPLIAPRAAEILDAPHFHAKEQSAFRDRLEMSTWSGDTCWKALLAYCEANKDKTNIEQFDLGHGLRIVKALVPHAHEYQGHAIGVLAQKIREFRDDPRIWLQPLLAHLAGHMRWAAASALLAGNLGNPCRFLTDQSLFALAKIGTEEVVSIVCEPFRRASQEYRLDAADLLCKIHLDSAVDRALILLPQETDLSIRMTLCEALIDHFSFEGIEPVRQFIARNELTPDLRELRSRLIAACKIMGTRFPEFDAWEAEVREDAHNERKPLRLLKTMTYEADGDLGSLLQKLQAVFPPQPQRPVDKPPRPASSNSHWTRIGKSSPKKPDRVGRNDPCPCGSGKKFKVCCLRT